MILIPSLRLLGHDHEDLTHLGSYTIGKKLPEAFEGLITPAPTIEGRRGKPCPSSSGQSKSDRTDQSQPLGRVIGMEMKIPLRDGARPVTIHEGLNLNGTESGNDVQKFGRVSSPASQLHGPMLDPHPWPEGYWNYGVFSHCLQKSKQDERDWSVNFMHPW